MRKLEQGTKIHVSALGVTTHFYMGKVHREDGPAVHSDTHQIWMKAGKVHREDGPAFVDIKNNKAAWYLQGTPITVVDFNQPNADKAVLHHYWHKET